MSETWYVLEDGSAADPRDVAPDKTGVLRHKEGTAVAMRGQVPSTRGVDPEEERAKRKPKAKEMKPADENPPYSTREVRSR